VFKDGNVFGDSVNIASRVESMGVPGSVLVSSNVRNQIKNKPVFELVNLGKFEFKNIQEGMTVFALANEGLVVPQKEALKGKFKIPSSTSTTDKPNTQNRLVTGLIMLATIVGVFFLGRSFLNQGVDGQNELIEIKDEEGKKVRALVPALSSVKSVACFQFENLTGDATQDWLGVAFSHLLGLDLDQRPEFYTYSAYGLNRYYDRQGLASFKIPSMSMQREVAQRSRNDYFTRIAYTFEENQFVFEGHLYSSKDGKSIVAIKTSNADLYAAIDAIKQQISEHIPGAAQELESQVSLPASNLITSNMEALKYLTQSRIAFYQNPSGLEVVIQLAKKAVELDPTCAVCHFYVGDPLYGLGRTEEAISYMRNAVKYGKSLPERMQFGPKGVLYSITNKMDAYLKLQEVRRKMFPYEFSPYQQLLPLYKANYGVDSAKALIQEAIDNGNLERGLVELYGLQLENEEYKAAEKTLNQLSSAFPDRDQDKLKYATIYEKQGRIKEAKEILLEQETLDPFNTSIQTNLALLDFKDLAISKALNRLNQSISQASTLTDSLNLFWTKAFLLRMSGQVAKSFKGVELYEKYSAKRTPLNRLIATTFHTKADMYQSIGQANKVPELLTELAKYAPESNAIYDCAVNTNALERDYEMLMKKEEYAACSTEYQVYGDGYSEYFDVLNSYFTEDYVNCIKILEEDKERVEKLFSTKYFVAKVYAKGGKLEKAKEILQKAINQKPYEPLYYYEMAVLLENEDEQKSKEYLDIALQFWADADVDYVPFQRAKDLAKGLSL